MKITGFKNSHTILIFGFYLILCGRIVTAPAQFYTLETQDLQLVYYDQAHRYVVPHLARCFENSFRFHQKLFGYKSKEKVTLLMHDLNDYGHGGTSTMPWNFLNIGMEPFDYVYETHPTNERMNWLMHHELVHVVTIDKAAGSDHLYRKIFWGKVMPRAEIPLTIFYSYLTNPRWYCPRWYHEGIAVFLETWMSGGIGRALGGYDEMVFRTMVRDNSYFYDVVGLESEGTTIDFQIGVNSYLYGTRFVSYLAYQNGPEKVINWFNRTPKSKRYYASQFKKTFGAKLDDSWSNWINWEKEWQQKNLQKIRQYPTTPYRHILQQTLGSVSRAYYDSNKQRLYTAINYPGQLAQIAEIDMKNGSIKKICEVPSPALYYVTFLAYDPKNQKLFYTTQNGRGWRDLNEVDIQTHQSRILLKDTRCGDLVCHPSDQSVWGVQHHNGYSSVVLFPTPYTGWIDVLTLPYGRDIFDLDISPDGKYLSASLIEVSGEQKLVLMQIDKLLDGDSSFDLLYEFSNNSPANFVFSPDGKYLFGTSYYTGVSNIWRYDLVNKQMDIVTNCESGFFRPVPFKLDTVITFRYSGKGFDPVLVPVAPLEDVNAISYLGQAVVNQHPVLKEWMAESPAAIELDSLITYQGKYRPLKNVKLASVYPIVEGYKAYTSYGLHADIMDPLLFHQLELTGSYSPTDRLDTSENFHATLKYNYWPWKFWISYNHADFYDLFGPTKVSRRGNGAGIQYFRYLINDRPKTLDVTLNLAGYSGLERLPQYQNIEVYYDRFLSLNADLKYSFLLSSLGAVEKEEGFLSHLTGTAHYVPSEVIPKIFGRYDYGFLLPWNHSSLWIRTAIGFGISNRLETLANFYFGGFGNNWVDFQEFSRYREYYSFPGADLNAIGGTNFTKLLLEWTLPPLRFKRFGMPSFYLRWVRLAVFSSGLMTNLDDETYRTNAVNVGGQLDFRLITFSHLKSTFSLGYAVAWIKDRKPTTEFMISLKIL